jgi:hypothetical protein
MAIDLDAIRAKLNQLSGKNRRSNVMWRPTEGETATIRLLSFPDNDGQPWKDMYFYYNIGNNPGLLAPYQYDKPDPVQELITKLRDDSSKESYELAKKLYPKMRTFAPVVVRGEEDRGVRLWSFGKMVYQDLLNLMLDEDYGDITDNETGRDIRVTCEKPPGRQFATTSVTPRGAVTPLTSDADQLTSWVDNIPSPSDLYELKTYNALEKLVNDWLNGDDTESTGTERGRTASTTTADTSTTSETTDSTTTTTKSLDDAFADLEDL